MNILHFAWFQAFFFSYSLTLIDALDTLLVSSAGYLPIMYDWINHFNINVLSFSEPGAKNLLQDSVTKILVIFGL